MPLLLHTLFQLSTNSASCDTFPCMPLSNGSTSIDWDDVRVFLAVARHGSLRAAGRVLGLSQPTIGRRLSQFEAAFGGPALFDRLPEGLRLTWPAGIGLRRRELEAPR